MKRADLVSLAEIVAGLASLVAGLVIAGASATSHAPPVFFLGGLALSWYGLRTMAAPRLERAP